MLPICNNLRAKLHTKSPWWQAGFTRLQNVMIVVIAAVLILVASYAFLGYRQSAYLVKANRTAARAFDATENYIRDVKASGGLTEFNYRAARYGGVVPADVQDAILESCYEGQDFAGFLADFHRTYESVPFYYMVLDGADRKNGNREGNPLLDIFENQLLDENTTAHTFLIIYNGNSGEVLSVLYSQKADTLTFEGELDDKTNAILRDEESLKQKWQGYCGADLEEM
ncbi:MAG: hypothetical protein ACI4AD_09380 [Roseburia sp.]